jgi:hypothetical protein
MIKNELTDRYRGEERKMRLSKSEATVLEKARRHPRGFVAITTWSTWSNTKRTYIRHNVRQHDAAERLVEKGLLERTNVPTRYRLVKEA